MFDFKLAASNMVDLTADSLTVRGATWARPEGDFEQPLPRRTMATTTTTVAAVAAAGQYDAGTNVLTAKRLVVLLSD